MEGKRGPECLLKPVSNIDFNPLESQYGIKTYYCHAYTPAERGSNERFNRNLRYFYPKGTRFEHISAQDLTTTLLQINQRTLKILDWQTPYQVMLTNLSKNSD
ncbi:putative transposase for insertion-like sequence element IS1161 (plasmid) [Pediococcus pentosaceus]|nr:putative transposase for insertion-like sequence element IS1161 [Pediococcus pentosaceus]